MDSQKSSRSSAHLKRPKTTIFDFQSDKKANADGSPFKLRRISSYESSSLALKEQNHCSDQIASAPPESRATSVTTSVATELVNSTERTPTDEDAENRCPIDLSIGDVLRRGTATRRLHISSNYTVDDPYVKTGWKDYPKEQILISKEFINDVMNTLRQISDYLRVDYGVSETSRTSLRLAAEIMQHRCEDIIAGVQPSKDSGQRSTLNPNQWQEKCMCSAEEDRLYD